MTHTDENTTISFIIQKRFPGHDWEDDQTRPRESLEDALSGIAYVRDFFRDFEFRIVQRDIVNEVVWQS